MLSADVNVGGTWDGPEFAGGAEIRGGAMSLPGLGVRYEGLHGGARFQGDSLVLDNVALRSGGSLASGSVRLEDLSRPVLDLGFRADEFRAVDVRSFLTLAATGGLRLQGPLFHSNLTGNLTANSGVLYFADLVSKRIIDLEDPTIADLVDTTLLRRENLGRQVPEPIPGFTHYPGSPGSAGLRRLAPVRRGQHPARAAKYSSARRARPIRPRARWTHCGARIP